MKGKDIDEMEFPDFEDDNKKITKLRMRGNSPTYVSITDYTTKINKYGNVVVKFKPEFIDYYGVEEYVTHIQYDKEDLKLSYPKERIRETIRREFKDHILSYLKKQNELVDNEYNEVFNGSFDFDDFPDFKEDKKSQSNSTENTDSLDDFEFDFEVESNKLDELTADEFEFDDFISYPTLPASTVIEYFESLFETKIDSSNLIFDYIAEASKKLNYLTYEAEIKQKITDKENEIKDLKSLLNKNKQSIDLSNEVMKKNQKGLKNITA